MALSCILEFVRLLQVIMVIKMARSSSLPTTLEPQQTVKHMAAYVLSSVCCGCWRSSAQCLLQRLGTCCELDF
jgi:hypothetical protein